MALQLSVFSGTLCSLFGQLPWLLLTRVSLSAQPMLTCLRNDTAKACSSRDWEEASREEASRGPGRKSEKSRRQQPRNSLQQKKEETRQQTWQHRPDGNSGRPRADEHEKKDEEARAANSANRQHAQRRKCQAMGQGCLAWPCLSVWLPPPTPRPTRLQLQRAACWLAVPASCTAFCVAQRCRRCWRPAAARL